MPLFASDPQTREPHHAAGRGPRAFVVLALAAAALFAACKDSTSSEGGLAAGAFDVAASGGLTAQWRGTAEHRQQNDWAYTRLEMTDGSASTVNAWMLLEHYGRPLVGSYPVIGTGPEVSAPDSGTLALTVFTRRADALTRLYLTNVSGTVQLDSASSWELSGTIDVTASAQYEGSTMLPTPVRLVGAFRSAPYGSP